VLRREVGDISQGSGPGREADRRFATGEIPDQIRELGERAEERESSEGAIRRETRRLERQEGESQETPERWSGKLTSKYPIIGWGKQVGGKTGTGNESRRVRSRRSGYWKQNLIRID
jgi:hypothetical protein